MHYLDHAATTPVLPEAAEAIVRILREEPGNPSSVHAFGRRARELVEEARERVAAAIGADPDEIVFTGGGTEADNLGIKGALEASGRDGGHVVTTAIEHHAVLDACEWLGRIHEVEVAEVDASGVVDPAGIGALVRPDTLLVSVMTVNNEIGTIQPISEIVRAVKEANPNTLVHTDAVQALGNIPVDVHGWGVDLAAFAAHKVGGVKGVGALYVRRNVGVAPSIHGGGQERGLRSGTLNVPGIAAFGIAAEIAAKECHHKASELRPLRDALLQGIKELVPDAVVNGSLENRVAGSLNVSIPGAGGQMLLALLDRAGVACSSGSACSSGALDPSHVLLAIGVPQELARGSLRFSMGHGSSQSDVDAVLAALPEAVERARMVG
jgi:cysteine desulfurase